MSAIPSDARRWIQAADRRLNPVVLASLRVRVALDVAFESTSSDDILEDASAPLLSAALDLVAWLQGAVTPEGLEDAAAELRAAAGVYRNAAVVYPGAPDLEGASRDARTAACNAMLQQGEHHVTTFRRLIA